MKATLLGRIASLIYGAVCYAIFFATFLYAVGFVGNLFVPKAIDGIPIMATMPALAVDLLLLGIFAIQHSVMARPGFKRVWTRVIPEPVERSTYVLFSSLALVLLFFYWQPLGGTIWSVTNSIGTIVLYAGFAFGWGLVLVSTFLINHFDLFGLRQVYLNLQNKEYHHLKFRTTAFYNYVRHPLMLGFIIAFWSTPVMTQSHLLFAGVFSAYILVALRIEERTLVYLHGDAYRDYQSRVPMLLPLSGSGKRRVRSRLV